MWPCARPRGFEVEIQMVLAAVRAVARESASVEDEMRCGSCYSTLLSVMLRYCCCAQNATVGPRAVEQDWGTQRPAHSVDAAAKMLDGRLIALVSCRSSSRSILLERRGRGLVDKISSLRCSLGSANFVTSKMRAVACMVVVRPLHSCCRRARQEGSEASNEWLSTRPDVHDVFVLFMSTQTLPVEWAVCFRGFASSCDVLFTRYKLLALNARFNTKFFVQSF